MTCSRKESRLRHRVQFTIPRSGVGRAGQCPHRFVSESPWPLATIVHFFFIFLIFPNIIRFDEKHSKRMDSFSLFLFLFALFVLLHDRQRCNLIQTFIELFWTFAIWKLRKHCNWEFSLQINLFQLILEWNQSFFFDDI